MTPEQLTAIINQQAIVMEAQKQLLINKTTELNKLQAQYGEIVQWYEDSKYSLELHEKYVRDLIDANGKIVELEKELKDTIPKPKEPSAAKIASDIATNLLLSVFVAALTMIAFAIYHQWPIDFFYKLWSNIL